MLIYLFPKTPAKISREVRRTVASADGLKNEQRHAAVGSSSTQAYGIVRRPATALLRVLLPLPSSFTRLFSALTNMTWCAQGPIPSAVVRIPYASAQHVCLWCSRPGRWHRGTYMPSDHNCVRSLASCLSHAFSQATAAFVHSRCVRPLYRLIVPAPSLTV